MQHQFWVARHSVLRRFGSREDECVVSSDAELDAKLELFRSIVETSATLQRLVEQLSERIGTLAHEEAVLGGFLREAGAAGGGAGRALADAGKGIAFCGQQRGAWRSPLARMQRELETFRGRGVSDTRGTVAAMERSRAEYRAALAWMKATSARLDPDSSRSVHQYRKAQAQVRESKRAFDKLTLDCLQKVDLLAAARCNMFSHILVHYQNSFLNFTLKASHSLNCTAKALSETPNYDFCILKELSQTSQIGENENGIDKDQILFFQEEYKDNEMATVTKDINLKENTNGNETDNINLVASLTDVSGNKPTIINTLNTDLAGLCLNDEFEQTGSFMPSQLLQNFVSNEASSQVLIPQSMEMSSSSKNVTEFDHIDEESLKKQDPQKKDRTMWFKLFAELDPLANPDAMPGINVNQSHAA